MTRKVENKFYKSLNEIESQHYEVFKKDKSYVITAREILDPDTHVVKDFLYQTHILAQTVKNVFNMDVLYKLFKRALEETIISLEMDTNLVNAEFMVSHSYYMIAKHNDLDQYSFFLCHGNQRNNYIQDNVQLLNIVNLKQYIQYILRTDHLEEAKIYFQDQFPNSDVTIHTISHIAFLVQPYDPTICGLKKKLFKMVNVVDDLLDIL